MSALLGIALLIVWVGAMVISWRKGKRWFAGLGLMFGIFPLIGAIRLAKPYSPWALDKYGPRQMALAMERFPKSADELEAAGGVRPTIAKKVL